MTDFTNTLRNVASNSTVRTTAAILAAGGFIANAFFGFAQSALGLGIQVVGASVTLGVVAANACQNKTDTDKALEITKDNSDYFMSFGSTFLPSLPTKAKRRNADNDTLDMAYGTGTRAGWKAWQ